MYCPQCRAEYREGFDRCAECDVKLVAELPPEDHTPVEHVVVFETTEPDVIPVIKSLLDSEEIPYLTEDEVMSNLFPGIMGAFYDSENVQIKFEVPVEYADRARELLQAHPDVPFPLEEPDSAD